MSLKDIDFQKCYDSDSDDILNGFYIPALSEATEYKRLAGFFSSSSLALAARGMAQFVRNEGQMKLVAGAKLRQDDVEAIKKAQKNPQEAIERTLVQSLENLEDEFIRNHVRALGWLIANGNLDVKVAVVRDEDGNLLGKEEIENRGIFHQKIGILRDSEGNTISFSGSDNETAAAWQRHIEEFKVFRDWVEYERDYLGTDIQRFEKFWRGDSERTEVMGVPEAVEKKLVDMAPREFDDLDLEKWTEEKGSRITKRKKSIDLWKIQERAKDKWFEQGKRGILEMATGTGKTFAALGCLDSLFEDENRLVTIIACPRNHLVKQWKENLEEFGITAEAIISDSSVRGYKEKLADKVYDINNGLLDKLIILTTHNTFSSNDFTNIVREVDSRIFLIVDEVHGIGSPKRREGLKEYYSYRLGLSATPERWFDEEGTEKIFDYFGGTAYQFSLKDAITTVNPDTGQTYLCPYNYVPKFVELTEDELQQYEKETKEIARAYYGSKNEKEKEMKLHEFLAIRRGYIIKNAQNKYDAFREILDEMNSVEDCLIFCSPQQIDHVQRILNDRNVKQHKFTQEEGTRKQEKYGGRSEREFLINKLSKGTYQALVAMKCLDEGVDVPPAENAIVLSSTGNPRQYIQRRGRVLRHAPDKERANIYDIIVVPTLSGVSPDFYELERKIIKKELKRYKEFAESAENTLECLNRIEEMEEKYNIS